MLPQAKEQRTMIQPMPTEAYQLGTPSADYRPKPSRQVTSMIAGVVIGLVGIGITFADLLQRRPAGIYFVGALLLGLGMWVVWSAIRNRGLQVLVFPEGLAYTARGATEVIHWDDITEVLQQITRHYTNGIYTGTTHTYTVRRAGKPELKFNDALNNVEQLGDTIQQETYRRLLPRAIATYNAGGILHFGKLSVSQQGLSNGKESIPWADVKGVKLEKGYISVSKQGKWLSWATATVAQTPNIFVFTALVDSIVGLNGKS